jgi:hypothetical protein
MGMGYGIILETPWGISSYQSPMGMGRGVQLKIENEI